MAKAVYRGPERRKFKRVKFSAPLAYKLCKKKTISKLLKGYTSNVSQAGLLCNIKDRVNKNDLLWLVFDRSALAICEQLEKESFVYQNGIIGKVVRAKRKKDGTYDVGIQFITRKEKNLTHIYPKVYFLKKQYKKVIEPEEDEELKEETEDNSEEEVEEIWTADREGQE